MHRLLMLVLLSAPLVAMASEAEGRTQLSIRDRKIADLEEAAKEQEETRAPPRRKTLAMVTKALQLEAELEKALLRAKAAEDRAAALEGELGQARQRIAELEAELARLRARLAELEKRVAELEAENRALRATLEEKRGALAELERRKAEADARLDEFRNLLARFRKLIDAGKLRVKIVDGRMVVELATDVLFASGSAALSKDGKAAIVEVAAILREIPERKFQIEGHTDNVPISTAQYPSNWELAAARSITVVKAMLSAGMPGERISAAAFADVRPAMPNDTAEGKRANRRIEIVLLPDLASLPGFDELNRAAAGAN
jgi:chemotaxis protein MotB